MSRRLAAVCRLLFHFTILLFCFSTVSSGTHSALFAQVDEKPSEPLLSHPEYILSRGQYINYPAIQFSPESAKRKTLLASKHLDDKSSTIMEVKLRGFIPSPIVGIGFEDKLAFPLRRKPLVYLFGGDNRTFSYDEGSSRVDAIAILGFSKTVNSPDVDREKDSRFGITTTYDPKDCFHPDKKPFWWYQLYDTTTRPIISKRLERTTKNLKIEKTGSSNNASVQFFINGADPLLPVAPAMNAELFVGVKPATESTPIVKSYLANGGVPLRWIFSDNASRNTPDATTKSTTAADVSQQGNSEADQSVMAIRNMLLRMSRNFDTNCTFISLHAPLSRGSVQDYTLTDIPDNSHDNYPEVGDIVFVFNRKSGGTNIQYSGIVTELRTEFPMSYKVLTDDGTKEIFYSFRDNKPIEIYRLSTAHPDTGAGIDTSLHQEGVNMFLNLFAHRLYFSFLTDRSFIGEDRFEAKSICDEFTAMTTTQEERKFIAQLAMQAAAKQEKDGHSDGAASYRKVADYFLGFEAKADNEQMNKFSIEGSPDSSTVSRKTVLDVRVIGFHDAFPAFEVYLNKQQVYFYDPSDNADLNELLSSPLGLFGGPGGSVIPRIDVDVTKRISIDIYENSSGIVIPAITPPAK